MLTYAIIFGHILAYMNKCPKCNAELYTGAQFCSECGCNITEYKKTRTCKKCGIFVPKGKFCYNCGTELSVNDKASNNSDDWLNDLVNITTNELTEQTKKEEFLEQFSRYIYLRLRPIPV